MAIVRTLAAGFLGKRAARGLGRYIPNPVLRFAVVTAITAAVPIVLDRISRNRKRRRRIWK
jgi:hypothetical protein